MDEVKNAPEAAPEASAAADWAALEARANEGAGSVAEPAAPVGPDLAQELTGLILAFVAIAKPILPCLGEIYTPEVSGAAAGAVASVCDKYGWMQGGVMGDYGVEITAAIVLLPLGVATYNGVKKDLDDRRLGEQMLRQKKQAELMHPANLAQGQGAKQEAIAEPGSAVQGWMPPGGAVENG